jgi:homogentisate 1,2-dioxygenase
MFGHTRGRVSRQAHVGIPEGTFEEEFGRRGFFGRVSHVYHAHPPTGWTRIEGPLKPAALDLTRLQPSDADEATGEPVVFLRNDDVQLKISRRAEPMPFWVRNADGDDVWFVHRGNGWFETDFGSLRFEPGDYLVIPRGTTYRVVPETRDNMFFVIESREEITLPEKGMLGPQAIFDPDVLEIPEPDAHLDAPAGEYEVRIKRLGVQTRVFYPYHPLDVVGWKGTLSVWKLNVRDIRPIISPRYHLPPSVHTTFLAPKFVICTFVPRPFEEDPDANRVPFYHRNIDFDEVIFYHDGDFFSRKNIGPGMLTFHPQGIHHGPHPGASEKVAHKTHTDEVAVMVDARNPLFLTPAGEAVSNPDYPMSWQTPAPEPVR